MLGGGVTVSESQPPPTEPRCKKVVPIKIIIRGTFFFFLRGPDNKEYSILGL